MNTNDHVDDVDDHLRYWPFLTIVGLRFSCVCVHDVRLVRPCDEDAAQCKQFFCFWLLLTGFEINCLEFMRVNCLFLCICVCAYVNFVVLLKMCINSYITRLIQHYERRKQLHSDHFFSCFFVLVSFHIRQNAGTILCVNLNFLLSSSLSLSPCLFFLLVCYFARTWNVFFLWLCLSQFHVGWCFCRCCCCFLHIVCGILPSELNIEFRVCVSIDIKQSNCHSQRFDFIGFCSSKVN